MIFKKRIFYVFIIALFCSSIANAQKKNKDSLKVQIKEIRSHGELGRGKTDYIDLLNTLAKEYRFQNTDSLKLLSDEALSYSLKINYTKGKAFALLRRGDYYSDTGAELKAFELYQKSKDLAFSLNYPELKIEVLKSIAFHEFTSQNLKNSVLNYYAAIDLASENSLFESEAKLRHNLGYCYSNYRLFDEAQTEYLIADSLWSRLGENYQLKAMTMSNIALNAIEKGDLEIGETYIDRSIDLLSNQKEPLWLSRAFRTKSRYFFKKKNYHKALEFTESSDSMLRKVDNPRDQMEIDVLRAHILFELGDFDSSKKNSLDALSKAIAFKDSLIQIKSHDNLEKIQHQLRNIDSAYLHYKKSKQIKDLLRQDDEVQKIILLRAKMNFEKEKEKLSLENLKRDLTQQKYIQWIAGALISAIILTIIVYRSQQRARRLNFKLKEKTDNLESNEKRLKEINTNQKTLFSIVGHDLKGPILSLKELLKLMSKEKNKEILLQELLPKLSKYTDHVYFTVDNLLSWGEKQMKGKNIDPIAIRLKEISTRALDLYSEVIANKNLVVRNCIQDDSKAWGNSNDIEVVFRNLLNNAVKFSHCNGEISISTVQNETHIIVQFKDAGVGMSKEAQKNIFQSNQYYTTLGTNHEKGTGIGLLLCKELLSRNNGKMTIESSLGKGSTFSIHLPKFIEKQFQTIE